MRRALILSDLHLCPPDTHQLFTEDAALAGFIEAQVDGPPTELIMAGDVFDFLMEPGYTTFEADRSVARLGRILGAHPQVIAALKRFAARSDHHVTLLSGNHDPEIALPAVHEAFGQAIGAPHLGAAEVLRKKGDAGPAVYGRAIGDPERPIWVVHGDRWDDHNHIDIDRLRAAAAAGEPFELPSGSHLVMSLIRPLVNDGGHRWAPHLKPEIDTVMGLLLYLDPQRVSGFLKAHYGLSARLVRGHINRFVGRSNLLGGPGDEGTLPGVWPGLAAELDADAPEVDLAALEAALRDGWPADGPRLLAGHGGIKKALLRAWLRRSRKGDATRATGETDEVSTRSSARLPSHVCALIAGHTHGPRSLPEHTPPYFNSGTWIATGALPDGDLETLIDRIERDALPLPDAPRTYVEVTGPTAADIALRTWSPA